MAKLSGKEIISEPTEKAIRRLTVVSFIVIVISLEDVKIDELIIFGQSFPGDLFQIFALSFIVYGIYTLIINWVTDAAFFKGWYMFNKQLVHHNTKDNNSPHWWTHGLGKVRLALENKEGDTVRLREGAQEQIRKGIAGAVRATKQVESRCCDPR